MYIDHVDIRRKSFNACVYKESLSCIGMQVYKEKVFLIDNDGCIVFANREKIKQKKKRKEKERPRRLACYGHRKHKSFVESKHIFWKQETDAKSLFS